MNKYKVRTCLYAIAENHEQSAKLLYDIHDCLVHDKKELFLIRSQQYQETADRLKHLTAEIQTYLK